LGLTFDGGEAFAQRGIFFLQTAKSVGIRRLRRRNRGRQQCRQTDRQKFLGAVDGGMVGFHGHGWFVVSGNELR